MPVLGRPCAGASGAFPETGPAAPDPRCCRHSRASRSCRLPILPAMRAFLHDGPAPGQKAGSDLAFVAVACVVVGVGALLGASWLKATLLGLPVGMWIVGAAWGVRWWLRERGGSEVRGGARLGEPVRQEAGGRLGEPSEAPAGPRLAANGWGAPLGAP